MDPHMCQEVSIAHPPPLPVVRDLPKVGLINQMPKGWSFCSWFPPSTLLSHLIHSGRISGNDQRGFMYSTFTRKKKNLLISLVEAAGKIQRTWWATIRRSSVINKRQWGGGEGGLPGTCVGMKPHLKSQYDSDWVLWTEKQKAEKDPEALESRRSAPEPCSAGLKRQYVVVSSPPRTGLLRRNSL